MQKRLKKLAMNFGTLPIYLPNYLSQNENIQAQQSLL